SRVCAFRSSGSSFAARSKLWKAAAGSPRCSCCSPDAIASEKSLWWMRNCCTTPVSWLSPSRRDTTAAMAPTTLMKAADFTVAILRLVFSKLSRRIHFVGMLDSRRRPRAPHVSVTATEKHHGQSNLELRRGYHCESPAAGSPDDGRRHPGDP